MSSFLDGTGGDVVLVLINEEDDVDVVLDYRTFSWSKAKSFPKPHSDFLLKQGGGKRSPEIDIRCWRIDFHIPFLSLFQNRKSEFGFEKLALEKLNKL